MTELGLIETIFRTGRQRSLCLITLHRHRHMNRHVLSSLPLDRTVLLNLAPDNQLLLCTSLHT